METPVFSRPVKIGLIVTIVAGLLMFLLRDVVIPVAFSFLLAYFLDPLVDRMEARKIPRSLGILFIFLFLLLLMALFLLIFVPMIVDEVGRFAERLPDLLASAVHRASPLLQEWLGIEVDELLGQATVSVMEWMGSLTASDMEPVTKLAAGMFTGTYAAISALISLVLIPIFTFYFLRDFDRLKLVPLEYVPRRHHETIIDLFREIDEMLAGFIRGTGTVCLVLAVLYGAGYSISGVPLGLLIGIIAGMLGFIPYVGAGVGLILSLIMMLLDWQGWGTAIGFSITFIIVSQLESFVLTPKIVGDRVGLSPVVVIIALLVGAELFGFAGILVALPSAAVLKILWRRAKQQYKQTEFFAGAEK